MADQPENNNVYVDTVIDSDRFRHEEQTLRPALIVETERGELRLSRNAAGDWDVAADFNSPAYFDSRKDADNLATDINAQFGEGTVHTHGREELYQGSFPSPFAEPLEAYRGVSGTVPDARIEEFAAFAVHNETLGIPQDRAAEVQETLSIYTQTAREVDAFHQAHDGLLDRAADLLKWATGQDVEKLDADMSTEHGKFTRFHDANRDAEERSR